MGKLGLKLLGIVGILGLLGIFGIGAELAIFSQSTSESNGSVEFTLLVNKGDTPQLISQTLEQNRVISDGSKFLYFGKLTGRWKKLKTGEYKIKSQMTPWQIFGILGSGISVPYLITVPEGDNLFQIAEKIENAGLSASAKDFIGVCMDSVFIKSLFSDEKTFPKTLEGYLFPDTYHFNRLMTAKEMARAMVYRFKKEWGNEQSSRASELGFTKHQVITLASIIEKETGAGEERPKISSVFFNRLKKHMPLQSDPTTIYGIWEQYDGNLRKSDLLNKNEYNTYQLNGLPVGPISNPGKAAIQAALYPDSTPYFFFVSHGDGRHEFTTTYQDHRKAVVKFQLNAKARAGKSWRDLTRVQNSKK